MPPPEKVIIVKEIVRLRRSQFAETLAPAFAEAVFRSVYVDDDAAAHALWKMADAFARAEPEPE